MKYLELTEFTPPAGQEYVTTAYPGLGNYLLPSGMIVLVFPAGPANSPIGHWVQPGVKVSDRAPAGGSAGIDVHRLFDQMITLTSKDAP